MKLFYNDNEKLYYTLHKRMLILTLNEECVVRCCDADGVSLGFSDFNISSFIWLSPCDFEIGNEEIL
jgi:hypothetical protein